MDIHGIVSNPDPRARPEASRAKADQEATEAKRIRNPPAPDAKPTIDAPVDRLSRTSDQAVRPVAKERAVTELDSWSAPSAAARAADMILANSSQAARAQANSSATTVLSLFA
jgi:hypothetical protein